MTDVVILDFGGQYASLIARRVREAGVYCEIYPHHRAGEVLRTPPKGVILSGGPQSVYERGAATIPREVLPLGVPVLGICYGAQLLAKLFGGKVERSDSPEYGLAQTTVRDSRLRDSRLFDGIPNDSVTWMSHTDHVKELPEGFVTTAFTPNCAVAAMECQEQNVYAMQFHPEVTNTTFGTHMLKNFLFGICDIAPVWKMEQFVDSEIDAICRTVGNRGVLLGLSGGVDSSVCASLLSRAIGKNLTCVFVDHGLMREGEADEIEDVFGKMDLNFVRIDAAQRFFGALKGVKSPEKKRKIIGAEFACVFEEAAKRVHADFLAQGTIYPDVIESGKSGGAVIKSHHNVGGLPASLGFQGVVEPLRSLFKDEVRAVGRLLGLDEKLVSRQPFPGPGLAIRIIGTLTRQKAQMLQRADRIFRDEITAANLTESVHQFFAVLTPVRSVGVMGDARTYGFVLVLRGVTTSDFMTADFARIPYEVLARASARIVNEVKGITRVVYDITTKPPATIEWE